jgi:hypothetical protein
MIEDWLGFQLVAWQPVLESGSANTSLAFGAPMGSSNGTRQKARAGAPNAAPSLPDKSRHMFAPTLQRLAHLSFIAGTIVDPSYASTVAADVV